MIGGWVAEHDGVGPARLASQQPATLLHPTPPHATALQEACFRDVVVLYRRKVGQQGAGGEKEVLREGGAQPSPHNIALKRFSGIPMADLVSRRVGCDGGEGRWGCRVQAGSQLCPA